ncbi:MAG: four helix bundle protein [Ignavibacteria bacterium]|nr:four helix bundle protein [Ignavibacteria bacterium]MBK6760121.1 four helix bundle protein [Ignavibacteria bacterium]MBK7032635.1 four helix bundle protein [Ignavibacteria bacterium]MBK7185948.1 four helix bundle protein [Ignavibacteria bacterium]MBK7412091.1 four helix bundle protein [Ignavibacteria bacterium]
MGHERDIIKERLVASPLHILSIEFSREVRSLVRKAFQHQVVERMPLDQLYRSGSSVGANIRESRYAESPKDFVHKLKIAEKELGEFFYWIGLLSSKHDIFDEDAAAACVNKGTQVQKLLSSIIVTTKRNNSL